MDIGSLADWLSAVVAAAALIAAWQAYKQAQKSNSLLQDQVNEEVHPKPKLKFEIVGNFVAGNSKPDGYKLVVVNYGKAPAILNVLPWKKDKMKKEDGKTIHVISFANNEADKWDKGEYLPEFQNSVLIGAPEIRDIFIGKKNLTFALHGENIEEFWFRESVASLDYFVRLKDPEGEKLTVDVKVQPAGKNTKIGQ